MYVTEQEASALGRRILRRPNTELDRNQVEVVEDSVFEEQEGMPDGQPPVILKKARIEDESESSYAPIDVTTVDVS